MYRVNIRWKFAYQTADHKRGEEELALHTPTSGGSGDRVDPASLDKS